MHQAWNVYRHGKKIDTVFFDDDLDKDYVLDSLIGHDNYSPDINIRRTDLGRGKKKISQRKGGLGWTKFDGVTYTPLGLRVFPRKKTAKKIASCLKDEGKIKGYRILEADRPFSNSPKGHIVYIKGKIGHTGHLNKDIKACMRK